MNGLAIGRPAIRSNRKGNIVNILIVSKKIRNNFLGISQTITCALALILLAPSATFPATGQLFFKSPQAGVKALLKAMKANDESALRAIFGPKGSELFRSGDEVADARSRAIFRNSYDEASKIVLEGDAQATLVIGRDEWPLPIPLVKTSEGWRFDTDKGEDEILKRRIGRNELETIQVCLEIVDAEREYATSHLDASGVPVYASRFKSSPGMQDGLYWPGEVNKKPSPLGALLAAAADEGYTSSELFQHEPYHGYYFHILTGQGDSAPYGARDYFVNGKMIGGFAVIAYPARYGVSGVMSFLVNHDGVVYEKDLGQNTQKEAALMTRFNPGVDWVKSELRKQ